MDATNQRVHARSSLRLAAGVGCLSVCFICLSDRHYQHLGHPVDEAFQHGDGHSDGAAAPSLPSSPDVSMLRRQQRLAGLSPEQRPAAGSPYQLLYKYDIPRDHMAGGRVAL